MEGLYWTRLDQAGLTDKSTLKLLQEGLSGLSTAFVNSHLEHLGEETISLEDGKSQIEMNGRCLLRVWSLLPHIDRLHGVKQLISTFTHAIECSKRSVHDFLCWLLLYQTVTGSIEHLWALAFRNQVRESVTNSLRKQKSFISYDKHWIGLAPAGIEPTNKAFSLCYLTKELPRPPDSE